MGIKDTNDHLVSMTLKTLANLVPILGSTIVVGGKRAKLFNDGRPTNTVRRSTRSIRTSIASSRAVQETDQISINSLATELNNINDLPERPRPDGEEGETSTEEVEPSVDEDVDNWEDWDINESLQNNNTVHETILNEEMSILDTEPSVILDSEVNVTNKSKLKIPDILELDIKNQMAAEEEGDFNFFQDMEPVIQKSNKFIIDDSKNEVSLETELCNKLAVNATDDENHTGWEEEDWD